MTTQQALGYCLGRIWDYAVWSGIGNWYWSAWYGCMALAVTRRLHRWEQGG